VSYFRRFPLLGYTLDSGQNYSIVTDVLKRIVPNQTTKENYALIEEYDIKDGETPEIVAHKFYGVSDYHWIILLINDILDPRFDWPLSDQQLYSYTEAKYGEGNITAAHHYTISETNDIVVDLDQYPSAHTVSNFAHESNLNDTKRAIRVLRPEYLQSFISEFDILVNG
jgi:hypothetical protein